jgi:hypothetical protein
MSKTGPGAQPLPTSKKSTAHYMTPPTLAGKKGVESMGVKVPQEKDLTKREKVSETPEKISSRDINKFNMSKSLFEKLFEDVMGETDVDLGTEASDEAALGIEGGDDFGGEESGDEVTFTLDRATAEKLHAALGSILGGGEEAAEGGEEFGEESEEDFGGEGEEDFGGAMGESISVEPEPKPLKGDTSQFMAGKKPEPKGSTIKTSGGKAESGKLDTQAEPKALGAKADTLQKHGAQKVHAKASSTGKSLFDV